MKIIEIFLVGVGLSLDAMAVSICKGLATRKINYKKCLIISLYFGIFQAIMPLIGYYLGTSFERFIIKYDHWVTFILLFLIGFNMIKEAFDNNVINHDDRVNFKTMIILSIATSIDALAVGITFAFLKVNIVLSIIVIGFTTFILSFMGVIFGNKFGTKYEKLSSIIGGVILILIGLKILLEHLGIL